MPRNVFQETSSSFLSSSFRLFVPSIEASRTTKNFTKPRWNIFPPFGCVLSNEVTSFPFLSTKLIAPDRSSIFTRSGYFQRLKNKYAQPVESFPLSHFDLFEVIVKSLFDVGENNNNNNNKRTNTGREIFSLKCLRPSFSLLLFSRILPFAQLWMFRSKSHFGFRNHSIKRKIFRPFHRWIRFRRNSRVFTICTQRLRPRTCCWSTRKDRGPVCV